MSLSKDPGQATAQEFEHSLKDNARQLVDHLEQGDFAEALLVIHAINQARDRGLYHEVGHHVDWFGRHWSKANKRQAEEYADQYAMKFTKTGTYVLNRMNKR